MTLDIALDLAARGLFVFPVNANPAAGKRPFPAFAWRSMSTNSTETVERFWQRYPDALVAIDLAKSGLFVVDPDRHDPARDGPAMWQELCARHHWRDDSAPRVSTASLGEHIYFRNADPPFGNKAPVPGWIDGRGAGGYVVAPGSRYSDGSGFWRHAVETPPVWQAPPLPDWLAAMLRGDAAPAPPPAPPAPRQPLNDARREAIIEAAVRGEVEALRGALSGGRNNQLNTSAFNLAQFIPHGMISEGEIMGELTAVALDIGLKIGEIRSTIRSGIRAGRANPRAISDPHSSMPDIGPLNRARAPATAVDEPFDPETGEIIEAAGARPDAIEAGLSGVPEPRGMLGAIRDFVLAGSMRPNATLALASALATMAHLTSRHMAGPTRSSMHLYIVGLGRTGIGKDWPLKAPMEIFRAMDERAGTGHGQFARGYTTGKWKSDAAIETALESRPAQLAIIDEMGQLLHRVTNRRASSHEQAMGDMLRELWSVGPGEIKQTSATAGRSSRRIEYPCLTLFGMATPEEFYKALAGSMLENGFVNRLLILPAGEPGEDREIGDDSRTCPADLATRLLTILPGAAGNLSAIAAPLDQALATATTRLPWRGQEVNERWLAFKREIERRIGREGEECGVFLARTAETALRIAAIHAIGMTGRDVGMSVTMADLDFGIALALASAEATMVAAREHMAESEHQAQYKAVRRMIGKAGPGGITHSILLRNLSGKVRARELKDILEMLVQSGAVEGEDRKPPDGRGGHATRIYRSSP